MPLKGEITQPYKGEEHHGTDIASNVGTPFTATRSGKVEKVDFNSTYGNYLIISHGNGFESLYAHCSKVDVKEGDRVFKGQTVGRVGNTGNSSGSHLHFEIRVDNKTTDPMQYVQ